jgi:hypothetical protein
MTKLEPPDLLYTDINRLLPNRGLVNKQANLVVEPHPAITDLINNSTVFIKRVCRLVEAQNCFILGPGF